VLPGALVESHLRFAGQYYDAETVLRYNYYRYYSPLTGRYLKRDPLGLYGGINLFAYVQNNPILKIDPLGLAKCMVHWNYESLSFGKPIGGAFAKIGGVVVSMEKSKCGPCKGKYTAIRFKGLFGGVSMGAPVGGNYNNREIFSDNRKTCNVHGIQGMSWLLSGTIAGRKSGLSGGTYHFGGMSGTQENPSPAEGYDLGVDYVGGYTWTVGEEYCVLSPDLTTME
jgi:RHS repeat-associated protein